MIHELDESLRNLVRRDVVRGADVEVVFDAPTKDWAARRNTPTIDVYLYDIREDLRRRQYGMIDVKNSSGHTGARRQPARFYKLSYLVTAWTQRPEDEHRLLSGLLACFLRHDFVPFDVLQGQLRDEQVPFTMHIAIPPPEDRALSDVWSALGGELKPSLDLVVIAPFDLDRAMKTATIIQEDPKFSFERRGPARPGARGRPGAGAGAAAAHTNGGAAAAGDGGEAAEGGAAATTGGGRRQAGGAAGGGAAAAAAGTGDAAGIADDGAGTDEAGEAGMAVEDAPAASFGGYGREVAQRRRIPGLPSPPLDPDYEPVVAEETLSSGKPDRPGRIFRIRNTPEPEDE